MKKVSSYAQLDLRGGAIAMVALESGLPVPQVNGEMCAVNGRLWMSGGSGLKPAMLPVSVEVPTAVHSQGLLSSSWLVTHNFGSTGAIVASAWRPDGTAITPTSIMIVSASQCRLIFDTIVDGSAVVALRSGILAEAINASMQVKIGTVALTDVAGTINANGTALSLAGHGHSFASITSKPTTLAGYGITDAASLGSSLPIVDGVVSAGVATTAARSDHVHPREPSTFLQLVTGTIGSFSGTATMPINATPTSTTGTQVFSQAITMTTGTKVLLKAQFFGDYSSNSRFISIAFFRNTTLIGMTVLPIYSTGVPNSASYMDYDAGLTPGTTYTYSCRVGGSANGTWYINQDKNANKFGGGFTNSFSLTETA
jgi:hypothetical protein